MPTYQKSHNQRSVTFDAGSALSFDVVASVAINAAVGTVQAILPLPADFKVFHVGVAYTGTAATAQIQIGTGTGNLSGATVGTTDVNAPANTVLFATPPTLSAAAGTTQMFIPDVPDCIYAGSNSFIGVASPALTLRAITNGTGTIANLKVTLFGKFVDQHQAATMEPTPAGNYGYDPSTF